MFFSVFSNEEKSSVLPLLFPCGNRSKDTIPSALSRVGLKLNTVVCYNTTKDPSIELSLNTLSQEGVSTVIF